MAIHVEDEGTWVEATSGPAIGSLFGHAFTFSALYRPTILDSGTVLGVGSSGTSQYIALAMLDTGQGFLEVAGKDAFAASNFSVGDWHSLVGVQASATSRVFYANGVAGTANTESADPVSDQLDRTTVGALVINGNHTSTALGDVAEVAIWDVALTAAEAAMLAAHICPLLVRPSALRFYSPLWGSPAGGPEIDLVGGRALVYGGEPGMGVPYAVPHPQVFRPGGMATFGAPAAVTDVTVNAVTALTTYSEPVPSLSLSLAASAPIATYSAPTPTPTVAVSTAAAAVTFSSNAPVLTVGQSAPSATLTATGPAPAIRIDVSSAVSAVVFSSSAPGLQSSISSIAATVTFAAPAPTPAVTFTSPVAQAVYSASTPSLATNVTSAAATVTFSSPVPSLISGTTIAAAVGTVTFRGPTPSFSLGTIGRLVRIDGHVVDLLRA